MKKYIGMAVLAGVLVLAGCREKESIPLSQSSVSLEEEEVEDTLEGVELPGEEIPDYQVELPDKLSSFTIAIWGEIYELPMSWQDFVNLGWEYTEDTETTVNPQSYLQGEIFKQENCSLEVYILNAGTDTLPVTECEIAGLQINTAVPEGEKIYVNLPGGIMMQESVESEVTEAYGDPVDRYENAEKIWLTYEYGTNQSVQLGFDSETGILDYLDIQNLAKPENLESQDARTEPTDEVKAYAAPEKPGSTLKDFIVEYGGILYRLPAPVAEFEKNGWTVNVDESDYAVQSGQYGYATLEKDGAKLYAVVGNYSSEKVTVSNCFVTTLYGDLNTTKVPITITGGITLGMPEESFLILAAGESWEKEEDLENGEIIYTCYQDESKVDYTEVVIDQALRLVREIKVVNNADEELSQKQN